MQKLGFIDWMEGKLNFCIFEKKGSQHTLIDTKSVLFEGELNQSHLKPFLGGNIEYVYLSIPASHLSLRRLKLPFSDKEKIKDTLLFELEGILLGDVKGYSFDYLVSGSTGNGSEVLAACIEKTRLKDIISIFSSVGLEPAIVTSIELQFLRYAETVPELSVEKREEAVRNELANPTINLRKEELAYKGDIERISKSMRLTAALIFVLMLIFSSVAAIKLMFLKRENNSIKNQIRIIYQNEFSKETIVEPVRQVKGHLNSMKEKEAILIGMPVLDTLLNIANLKNKDITLNELSIKKEGILIKGIAQSFENVDEFKNTLASSFIEVKVTDSRTLPDKKIIFSIIAKERTKT